MAAPRWMRSRGTENRLVVCARMLKDLVLERPSAIACAFFTSFVACATIADPILQGFCIGASAHQAEGYTLAEGVL
jgi:hypothetical protein